MSERWSIDHGDCLAVLREAPDNAVDACVTDPPYELGFMGKKWDATGIAFRVETWAEILRVLKPGAHLIVFGGTRTYHRMACAVEDAGFEVRDMVDWLYGSGKPQAQSLLKPGHEPICMARKPGGAPSLRIDECRIAYASEADKASAKPGTTPATPNGNGNTHGHMVRTPYVQHEGGRWPANVVLDEDTATELGEQSRFFFTSKASKRERNTGCAVGNGHPTVKPIALMRHLVRLVTPTGGIVLDPFCGSGTTGVAAVLEGLRFAGIEQSAEYIEIARQRIGHAEIEQAA